MKRYVAAVMAVGALTVAGCANPDKSRGDAQDTTVVNHAAPEVVQFNNHYPNVETKCDGHGHRLFVTTHDSAVGRNVLVVFDPSCGGNVDFKPGVLRDGLIVAVEWPAAASPPGDYNYDPGIAEYDGYKAGDLVSVIDDDEAEGQYAGDSGTIYGFSRTGPGTFNPHERIEALIVWDDDMDPSSVDTDNLEYS